MFKIEAIIQPYKLDDVKESLKSIGVNGMTVTDVRGHGRQKGHKETYRGREYTVDLKPKTKVETVVPAALLEETLTIMSRASRTGQIGDGKIFVYPVQDAIRIRDGERGELAL